MGTLRPPSFKVGNSSKPNDSALVSFPTLRKTNYLPSIICPAPAYIIVLLVARLLELLIGS